jgi:hypothetical protein
VNIDCIHVNIDCIHLNPSRRQGAKRDGAGWAGVASPQTAAGRGLMQNVNCKMQIKE